MDETRRCARPRLACNAARVIAISLVVVAAIVLSAGCGSPTKSSAQEKPADDAASFDVSWLSEEYDEQFVVNLERSRWRRAEQLADGVSGWSLVDRDDVSKTSIIARALRQVDTPRALDAAAVADWAGEEMGIARQGKGGLTVFWVTLQDSAESEATRTVKRIASERVVVSDGRLIIVDDGSARSATSSPHVERDWPAQASRDSALVALRSQQATFVGGSTTKTLWVRGYARDRLCVDAEKKGDAIDAVGKLGNESTIATSGDLGRLRLARDVLRIGAGWAGPILSEYGVNARGINRVFSLPATSTTAAAEAADGPTGVDRYAAENVTRSAVAARFDSLALTDQFARTVRRADVPDDAVIVWWIDPARILREAAPRLTDERRALVAGGALGGVDGVLAWVKPRRDGAGDDACQGPFGVNVVVSGA